MYQDDEKLRETGTEQVTKTYEKPKAEGMEIISIEQTFPTVLPLLPISQATLFPGMVIPVILPEGKLTQTIEKASTGQDYVGVVLIQEPHSEKPVGTGPSTSVTGVPVEGTMGEGSEVSKVKVKRKTPFHSYGV
ncbi:hypothetical protein EBT16_04840, partial [bacterium]|nr:hypothetical protein [bacterium]